LFEFKKEISNEYFMNYISSEFFNDPLLSFSSDSTTHDSGTLKINDLSFNYKRISPFGIYIGSTDKRLSIEDTQQPFELSGDLSKLFTINDSGWKGILAKEIITSIPVLKALKSMLDNTASVKTDYRTNNTRIQIKFKNQESAYLELLKFFSETAKIN
jgi:hypothetical protein